MKKKEASAFEQFRESLSEADIGEISRFFIEFEAHTALPRREEEKMRRDFENAILYYTASGLPLSEALARIDPVRLGGFYVRPSVLWYPLDDAAKVYPLSMRHGQMAVFRLSAYLKEQVVPEILQLALTFAIRRFPGFATTVKKGFFWHYLDSSKRRYCIEEEAGLPGRPLNVARSGSQSFRVLYYENRISVEYFHILTDGSGGLVFLKTLTAEYLRLMGITFVPGDGVLDTGEPPRAEETANEFARADRSLEPTGLAEKPALQMGGRLSAHRPCRVLHFNIDAAALGRAASERGTTVTVYILSRMFAAARYATDETKGSFNIQVPVNMRKFYPSETLRNFAMYCGIKIPAGKIASPDALIGEISGQLREKGSRESMSRMMRGTEKLVNTIRYIPLFIKAPVAQIVYGFLGDRAFTCALSNLGVVSLPKELEERMEGMDFVLGTSVMHRASCALVTLCGRATLSITKMTADPSFEEKLLELFSADGLAVEITGGDAYEI